MFPLQALLPDIIHRCDGLHKGIRTSQCDYRAYGVDSKVAGLRIVLFTHSEQDHRYIIR